MSSKFDEFIMVAPGSDYGIAMWSDIKKLKNAKFLNYVIDTDNKLLNLLHHFHFSFRINNYIQLPLQWIWKSKYSIHQLNLDAKKQYCIIFTDISACRVDISYLKELFNKPNIKTVIVLVNVVKSKENLILKRLDHFHYKYSFDQKDCEKYGFNYYPTFYSKVIDNKMKQEITSDAFFVGTAKGDRHEKLKRLYSAITKVGGKCDFYISGKIKMKDRIPGIYYNKWLRYSEVLEKIMHTNCVVEIGGGV